MYFIHIGPLHSPCNSSKTPSPYPLRSMSSVLTFWIHLVLQICVQAWVLHWSMDKRPSNTPLKKINSPFLCKVSTVNSFSAKGWFHEPLSIHARILSGLILYRSYVGNHSCNDSMCSVAMTSAEVIACSNPLNLWLLQSFFPFFQNDPWALGTGII